MSPCWSRPAHDRGPRQDSRQAPGRCPGARRRSRARAAACPGGATAHPAAWRAADAGPDTHLQSRVTTPEENLELPGLEDAFTRARAAHGEMAAALDEDQEPESDEDLGWQPIWKRRRKHESKAAEKLQLHTQLRRLQDAGKRRLTAGESASPAPGRTRSPTQPRVAMLQDRAGPWCGADACASRGRRSRRSGMVCRVVAGNDGSSERCRPCPPGHGRAGAGICRLRCGARRPAPALLRTGAVTVVSGCQGEGPASPVGGKVDLGGESAAVTSQTLADLTTSSSRTASFLNTGSTWFPRRSPFEGPRPLAPCARRRRAGRPAQLSIPPRRWYGVTPKDAIPRRLRPLVATARGIVATTDVALLVSMARAFSDKSTAEMELESLKAEAEEETDES